VVLTHANLIAGVLAVVIPFPIISAGSMGLGLLPFFHVAGMVCVLHSSLYAGATLVLLRRFDPALLLQMIQDYRIEGVSLVPPILIALTKFLRVEALDLSSLKLINSGAAPLGAKTQRACEERFGVPVTQAYGMTETAGLTHGKMEPRGDIKHGSVGPCGPNTLCKVVDPASGVELGPNEQGELWMRGPQIMKGYLNNPEATAQAIDVEGWYHTGDIGYADRDGYFYISDRVKEMIKYKGYQVAPAELEAILITHPAIAEAAVLASPDEQAGEVPMAFVVARTPLSAQEVIEFVAARVAPYKKVRRVEFIDELPKSPAGKLLRRVLRERELQRMSADQPS